MARKRNRSVVKLMSGLLLCLATALTADEPRFRLRPLDASGVIPYYLAEAADRSQFRPGDRQLAAWALDEWQRTVGSVVRFEQTGNQEAALLRFDWLPWAEDAALGRMEPATINGHPAASIVVRFGVDVTFPFA